MTVLIQLVLMLWECRAVFDDVPLINATEHSILVDDPGAG